MPKFAIITDTDSSLPVELAKKYGIRQVPITVHFGDESYTTGVDLDDRLVFEKVDRLKKIPTTSAPAPSAFAAAFEAAFKDGADTIICICVSSRVSATYNAAVAAAESLPQRDIHVIDSLNLCMGQGFMALAAAEAASAGATTAEILTRVESVGKRLHTYAVLPTLKYLALSGRVGKLAAGMATTLSIMPILTVQEGKLDLLEKIRTQKKAIDRMMDLVKESVACKPIEKISIIHVNNLEGAKKLAERLEKTLPCPPEIVYADFTPGLSVHAGTGVVGVVIQTAQ
jgi:DegV family protein with EDD domain